MAPNTSGAVEIEKCTAAGARAMLDDKVAVEQDCFHPSEQRVVPVEVGPAGLDHTNPAVLEIRNRTAQKIRLGQEIRVENANKLAFGGLQAVFQRAGLKALAIVAMDVDDR